MAGTIGIWTSYEAQQLTLFERYCGLFNIHQRMRADGIADLYPSFKGEGY